MVEFVSKIDANANDVYNWHQNFGANDRLTPPWATKKFLRREKIQNSTIEYKKTSFGVEVEKTESDFITRSIKSYSENSIKQVINKNIHFDDKDNQTIFKETASTSFLKSIVPGFITNSILEKQLLKDYNFRKARIENDIKEQAIFKNLPRQNIAILGEHDDVSHQIKAFFNSCDNKVFMFVNRRPYSTAREIQLNLNTGYIGTEKLKYINNILFYPLSDNEKLTEENLPTLLEQQKLKLKIMIEAFKHNKKFPESFIMLSSTCVYANNGKPATEKDYQKDTSPLAKFYLELEKEAEVLRLNGVRVIYARLGNVMSAKTGYLKQEIKSQKTFFQRQQYSNKNINWVSLDDAIYAINHMVFNPSMFGEINVCSSADININDLNLLLSQKINRSMAITQPKIISNYFNNDIMQEKILQHNTAKPVRLQQYGYNFKFNSIDDALNWETGSL